MSGRIRNRQHGFTLMELMIVVAMIGILAAIAIPDYRIYVQRSRIAEGFALLMPIKKAVNDYYDRWGEFPSDNQMAGLPPADQIRGHFVQSITVQKGMLNLKIAESAVSLGVLYLIPAVHRDHPTAPVLWSCQSNKAPDGYIALGEPDPDSNRQNSAIFPNACR